MQRRRFIRAAFGIATAVALPDVTVGFLDTLLRGKRKPWVRTDSFWRSQVLPSGPLTEEELNRTFARWYDLYVSTPRGNFVITNLDEYQAVELMMQKKPFLVSPPETEGYVAKVSAEPIFSLT